MTTKIEVYNAALTHLGEREIASLSEDNEPRRALDSVYSRAAGYCLERGMWNFGKRTISITPSEDIAPEFGFTNAFEKPDDWVRTMRIADNENFAQPLMHMQDEAGVWYADVTPLYVEYVSNGTSYGMNLSKWPETFTDYVSIRLARLICRRITSSDSKYDEMRKDEIKALTVARANDAMNQPPGMPPQGTWVVSRSAGRTHRSRWDGTTR
jgi:hypothetical protein